MMNREALEFLITEGENKNPIIELDQGTFSKIGLSKIKEPVVETLVINTLTGLADFIKNDIDELGISLLIHVKSPNQVVLYGPLNRDRNREEFISVQAQLPHNITYGDYLDTERFNIMLQSSFVDTGDKSILLKYTGLVRDEAVKDTGDNGISQKVTIKTGIASVGEAEVPNPVTLAPYRTFTEIEQPDSKFIFRMKDGPRAAIFEADGGAWRNKAILSIKKYLKKELGGLDNIEIIA